jgi:putative lipoprotein (rSAM/lipoprotein system)
MKNKAVTFFDKIVMALLGLFPFLTACDDPRTLYGTPSATYVVKGRVTDETTHAPLQNIRVMLHENDEYPEYRLDTVQTDELGAYSMTFTGYAQNNLFIYLKAEDVDGEANGGLYQSAMDTAQVTDSNWDKSDAGDWNMGTATVVKDIKLKK